MAGIVPENRSQAQDDGPVLGLVVGGTAQEEPFRGDGAGCWMKQRRELFVR